MACNVKHDHHCVCSGKSCNKLTDKDLKDFSPNGSASSLRLQHTSDELISDLSSANIQNDTRGTLQSKTTSEGNSWTTALMQPWTADQDVGSTGTSDNGLWMASDEDLLHEASKQSRSYDISGALPKFSHDTNAGDGDLSVYYPQITYKHGDLDSSKLDAVPTHLLITNGPTRKCRNKAEVRSCPKNELAQLLTQAIKLVAELGDALDKVKTKHSRQREQEEEPVLKRKPGYRNLSRVSSASSTMPSGGSLHYKTDYAQRPSPPSDRLPIRPLFLSAEFHVKRGEHSRTYLPYQSPNSTQYQTPALYNESYDNFTASHWSAQRLRRTVASRLYHSGGKWTNPTVPKL